MFDERVHILGNRKINGKYWKLVFRSRNLAHKAEPGQFVQVRLEDKTDPYLRRPFSYYRTAGDTVEVLYEILGRGTALLAAKRSGDTLQVLGPLGKPFARDVGRRTRVLIAGGIGVPPLVFLAERWRTDFLFIGCKSKEEALPARELRNVKGRVWYTTEDGSFAKKGLVTVLLHELLQKNDPHGLYIQCCGPHGMMQAVMKIARELGVAGEVSVDERMACGVGTCLGCVVKTTSGYRPSCVEGPVFSFSDLVA
jgi:dihydroorotate dehydrogenase electron transfer subunit